MPQKRKSRGRSKGRKGRSKMVQCGSCGSLVPRDKAKKVTHYKSLVDSSLAKELKAQGLNINQVLKHADVPEYCYKDHPLWEEGGRRHTGWVNSGIKYWYRHV